MRIFTLELNKPTLYMRIIFSSNGGNSHKQSGKDRPSGEKARPANCLRESSRRHLLLSQTATPFFDGEVEMVELRLGSECFLEDPLK